MKTYLPKTDAIDRKWYVVDADGKTLGRLATRIAAILRGKHKPTFTPHLDTGDFVVVVNADKVAVTGKKETDKIYYHHTMYPNGLKSRPLGRVMNEKPEEALKKAVWGMLPKARLGRDIFKKLKVYAGEAHPHKAQLPVALPEQIAR
ncbi:MAG: 50S ribosomal protein L13 [Deltaproteobacteria bacterium]|nr:50S ribosomal protein L13 [Deltaproteobacteria bacterium]